MIIMSLESPPPTRSLAVLLPIVFALWKTDVAFILRIRRVAHTMDMLLKIYSSLMIMHILTSTEFPTILAVLKKKQNYFILKKQTEYWVYPIRSTAHYLSLSSLQCTRQA